MVKAFGNFWTGQYQCATTSNNLVFSAIAFTEATPIAKFPVLELRTQRVRWGNSASCMRCLNGNSFSQRCASDPGSRRGSSQTLAQRLVGGFSGHEGSGCSSAMGLTSHHQQDTAISPNAINCIHIQIDFLESAEYHLVDSEFQKIRLDILVPALCISSCKWKHSLKTTHGGSLLDGFRQARRKPMAMVT